MKPEKKHDHDDHTPVPPPPPPTPSPKKPKCLFILKRRHDYNENYGANHLETGMFNSAKFVVDMLNDYDIHTKLVIVVDNNDIDREVTKFKPTHVFLEGIWVVPEKFDVLKKLHPTVQWIVRCHSEIPFLAQEGNAIDWIFEYVRRGVLLSCNSPRATDTLQRLVGDSLGLDCEQREQLLPYLPNYYPAKRRVFTPRKIDRSGYIDIGCFGAIRPLKNQLIQAVAAVEFAKSIGAKLRFHINTGRIEQHGNNGLKNIRLMFKQLGEGYELVEHGWLTHGEFKDLLKRMDVCMQVSMSETFNIVTADAVSVGTPTVVSSEIAWGFPATFANPTDIEDIVIALNEVWEHREYVVRASSVYLALYSRRARHRWIKYFLTCN